MGLLKPWPVTHWVLRAITWPTQFAVDAAARYHESRHDPVRTVPRLPGSHHTSKNLQSAKFDPLARMRIGGVRFLQLSAVRQIRAIKLFLTADNADHADHSLHPRASSARRPTTTSGIRFIRAISGGSISGRRRRTGIDVVPIASGSP